MMLLRTFRPAVVFLPDSKIDVCRIRFIVVQKFWSQNRNPRIAKTRFIDEDDVLFSQTPCIELLLDKPTNTRLKGLKNPRSFFDINSSFISAHGFYYTSI